MEHQGRKMKINLLLQDGAFYPHSDQDRATTDKLKGAIYEAEIKSYNLRTAQQNRALWLWCEMLSETLNASGLYIESGVLRSHTQWTKDRVKSLIVDPVIESMGVKSSTKLTKEQFSDMIEVVEEALARRGVDVSDFPRKKDV
jgi:hypothetical protein